MIKRAWDYLWNLPDNFTVRVAILATLWSVSGTVILMAYALAQLTLEVCR